jgi:predicted nucleic acid-binding protein
MNVFLIKKGKKDKKDIPPVKNIIKLDTNLPISDKNHEYKNLDKAYGTKY